MTLKEEGSNFLILKSVIEKKALIEPDVVVVCDNGLKAFTVPFSKNKVPVVLNVMGQNFLKNLK
jgi:hypothetical protein